MARIPGKYTLESSDNNFENFMKALGVGMVMRKLAGAATPSVEFTGIDGGYTMKTQSTVKNLEITFKLGQAVDETTADGRHCKTTFVKEGDNVLIQTQKATKGKDAKYTRTFHDDHMIMECECDGVKSVRKYKRN